MNAAAPCAPASASSMPAPAAAPRPPQAQPLAFTCPACGISLAVQEPDKYDGSPAPCPYCAVMVLPPRVYDPAAEKAVDLHPLPGLSPSRMAAVRAPRAVHRMARHFRPPWDGRETPGVALSSTH